MVLFFTALEEQKKIKIFSFQPDQLELGLDFINIINAQGSTILSAHIVDENGATPLPLDVFDGNPVSAPIQALEKEWKKLLRKPEKKQLIQHTPELLIRPPIEPTPCENPFTDEIIALLRRRIQIYDDYILSLDSTIDQLEELMHQAKQFGIYQFAEQYKLLIHKNEDRIAKAQHKLQLLIEKLHRLQYK